MKLKQVSIGLTVAMGLAASQGCMAEPMDEGEIDSAEQAACASYTYAGTFAAVITAMAREMGELHPTKFFVKQTNMWGNGRDGLKLTQAAKDACAARGVPNCPATQLLLDMQDPGINGPGMVSTTVFAAEDYRSNMVSKLQDQINYENSRSQNGQCLPGAHTLTEDFEENGATWPAYAECGMEYRFATSFGSSAFEVTREAESYNSINLNGSMNGGYAFSWTASGSNMNIGPNRGDYKWLSNVPSTSPNMVYQVNFPAAGTYKVWLRGSGADGFSDSAYVGINNTTNMQIVDLPENSQHGWASGDISVPSAGTHNVHVFAREDGLNLDKLVVNQSSTAPGASGGCTTPADLKIRIEKFSVPNVNFRADSTGIMCDPDPEDDPTGGGSGSGSGTCGNQTVINYSTAKLGQCCQTGNKTYQPYRCTNGVCSHLICKL